MKLVSSQMSWQSANGERKKQEMIVIIFLNAFVETFLLLRRVEKRKRFVGGRFNVFSEK